MTKRKVKKKVIRTIARERIEQLFTLADEALFHLRDQEKANRYAYLAKRISMRSNVKIPKKYKRRICQNCKSYLLPGFNSRIRIKAHRTPHVVQTCLECNHKKRYIIKKRNKNEENKES